MANNIFDFANGLPSWVILGFGVVTGSLRTAWSFVHEYTIGYAMTRISLSLTVEDVEHHDAYLWLSHWVEANLRHRRIKSDGQSNVRGMRTVHSLRVQIWLTWDRDVILDILRDAKTSYKETQPAKVEYFRTDHFGDWIAEAIAPRSLQSVYHPEDLIRDLIGDVETYLNSRIIYNELGIPYRRGYLLAGPPGTGKSTLILAIASHLKLPIYAVPLRGRR